MGIHGFRVISPAERDARRSHASRPATATPADAPMPPLLRLHTATASAKPVARAPSTPPAPKVITPVAARLETARFQVSRDLEEARLRFASAQTPDAARRVLLGYVERLARGTAVSLEQATLLLYMAVDLVSSTGEVDPALDGALLELFVQKELDAATIRAFRELWFAPYGRDLDEKGVAAAHQRLVRRTKSLDVAGAQKLLALVASEHGLSPNERSAIEKVITKGRMSTDARDVLSTGLVDLFVEALEGLSSRPIVSDVLLDDLLATAASRPDHAALSVAIDDLFLRARLEPDAIDRFRAPFTSAPPLTKTELDLAHRVLAAPGGTLDAAGVHKLLVRLDGPDAPSADARALVEGLARTA
ncbi:hypothetical protein L6R52_36575, partial [Myxococcota bacterium]|nr:hypothetical protein [Myxococcota bacterium]